MEGLNLLGEIGINLFLVLYVDWEVDWIILE